MAKSCSRSALGTIAAASLRFALMLLACLAALPTRAEPPPAIAAPGPEKTLSAADFFRCRIPPGWTVMPDHSFGLSAGDKRVFAVSLQGPWREAMSPRISATYYAAGNLLHQSAEHYLRIFAPASPGARPATGTRPVTVSGKVAMQFERERREFVPMHSRIGPEGATPGDDPRVYERPGELMARAVPVRERFVVIPGKAGFHALRYSAEARDFQEFLPDFEQLAATFEILE